MCASSAERATRPYQCTSPTQEHHAAHAFVTLPVEDLRTLANGETVRLGFCETEVELTANHLKALQRLVLLTDKIVRADPLKPEYLDPLGPLPPSPGQSAP